jgi:hypothetical protein
MQCRSGGDALRYECVEIATWVQVAYCPSSAGSFQIGLFVAYDEAPIEINRPIAY